MSFFPTMSFGWLNQQKRSATSPIAYKKCSRYITGLFLLLAVHLQPTHAFDVASQPEKFHQQAIAMARDGQLHAALNILLALVKGFPDKQQYRYDYAAVLHWSGQNQAAMDVFKAFNSDLSQPPDYVLEAIGKAARETQQFQIAVDIYQELSRRHPLSQDYFIGLNLAMADTGDSQQALLNLLPRYRFQPRDLDYLAAIAYVYGLQQDYIQQAFYYQKYLHIQPAARDIRRAYIFSLKNVGASTLALQQARSYPDALSAKEVYQLRLDQAAQRVRWGALAETDYRKRYVDTDKALKDYQQLATDRRWLASADNQDQRRKQYDRIIALHDRYQMQQVIDEYQQLKTQQPIIPNYVLRVVAAAYLYQQQPEDSLAILKRILETQTDDYKSLLQLFYTVNSICKCNSR